MYLSHCFQTHHSHSLHSYFPITVCPDSFPPQPSQADIRHLLDATSALYSQDIQYFRLHISCFCCRQLPVNFSAQAASCIQLAILRFSSTSSKFSWNNIKMYIRNFIQQSYAFKSIQVLTQVISKEELDRKESNFRNIFEHISGLFLQLFHAPHQRHHSFFKCSSITPTSRIYLNNQIKEKLATLVSSLYFVYPVALSTIAQIYKITKSKLRYSSPPAFHACHYCQTDHLTAITTHLWKCQHENQLLNTGSRLMQAKKAPKGSYYP